MLFQRFSEIDHITNEFLDPMNAAITRFVERQLFLNSDMSAKELSAVKSKGRMGYLALQDSLATVNRYMSQKSLSEDPTSSEYKLFSESVEVDKTTFHKRQNSLINTSRTDYCMFCDNFYTRIDRHLSRHHRIEPQVSEYMSFSSTDPPRFRAMRRRFIGQMNKQFDSTLKSPQKFLRVNRKGLTARVLPCPYCFHDYVENKLSLHMNTCSARNLVEPEKRVEKGQRGSFKSASRMEAFSDVEDEKVRSVLSKMKDDPVSELIRKDDVLMRYLQYQCKRYCHLKAFQTITQKARSMGSFLQHCMTSEKFNSFSEILDPLRFDEVYEQIIKFAGKGQAEDFNLKFPSKTKSTPENLKELAFHEELHFAGIDTERAKDINTFYRKLEANGHILLRMAREALKLRKFNKTQMFPLFNELKEVSMYLDKVIREASSDSLEDYKRLCNSLLAKIILFNRKRPREVSQLKWSLFDQALLAHNLPPNPDLYDNLDDVSKFLVKKMFRIEFLGKRTVKTAALLTPSMLEALKRLRRMRTNHVHPEQTLIFARPGMSNNPYNGGSALKEAARDAGASNPQMFLTTGLRKHLATMSQAVHMSEHMQEDLAIFMQHRLDIHRDIYTLPQGDIQKFKITRCLWQLNFGSDKQLNEFRFESEESEEDESGWCC